jgi:hypothetical protein
LVEEGVAKVGLEMCQILSRQTERLKAKKWLRY